MCSLYEEEIEKDLASDVKDKADINGGAAESFGREVPSIDDETGGKEKA